MLTFSALSDRGEPVTGRYFERYWLPIVGPSALLTMRLLADELERADPFTIHEVELARRLGIKATKARATRERLVSMRLLVPGSENHWAVRLNVRPLDDRQVDRLPARLADQHREMTRMLAAI